VRRWRKEDFVVKGFKQRKGVWHALTLPNVILGRISPIAM
jgi:hypothetical protein